MTFERKTIMKIDTDALKKRIEEILLDFVAIRSDANTELEKGVDGFFKSWFEKTPYFREHPELCGLFPIPDDELGRSVAWCLRKGRGDDTVVMIHHCDCVETSDYSGLESVCLKPYELARAFKENGEELPRNIEIDLDSGEWLFGRGVADMKGGGAIELALVEEYCRNDSFKGNVLVLSVPDEENLSAGMRGACVLMKQLKDRHNLKYVLMIDTESHERDAPDKPMMYDGSVGKIMPVVYVRGKVAHVGQIYSGLNPINLLADIIRRTELNVFFIEKSGNTVSPPAAWLYAKDRKTVYDVSLPMDASGYMSILPLERSPREVMDTIKEICLESFVDVLRDMNESYKTYRFANNHLPEKLPFKVNVKFFSELYDEAIRDSGGVFVDNYARAYTEIKRLWYNNELSTIDGVNRLIATALKHVKDPYPMVIVALAPPYYPSVNNSMLSGPVAERAREAILATQRYAETEFKQKYHIKNYYTGISDLSYAMFSSDDKNIEYIRTNMLLWGSMYSIPLELIKEFSMPVVNIGPWGKDIHKYTERVYKDDLFRVTPDLVNQITCDMLGN